MSLAIGSAAVTASAAPLPLSAPGPGCLVITNTGANPATIGGSHVVAAGTGPGTASIPAGGVVSLPAVSGVGVNTLYAISAAGTTLNWFYGTEVTP